MGASKRHRSAMGEVCDTIEKALTGWAVTLRLCLILLVLAVPLAVVLALAHSGIWRR